MEKEIAFHDSDAPDWFPLGVAQSLPKFLVGIPFALW